MQRHDTDKKHSGAANTLEEDRQKTLALTPVFNASNQQGREMSLLGDIESP